MKTLQRVDAKRANGTCLQGYLDASYEQITKAFGKPQLGSSDGKVQAEWVLADGALVATIYDYKSSIAPKRNRDWHIGGNSSLAVEVIGRYFPGAVRSAR